MFVFFAGLAISTIYGGFATALIWHLEGESESMKFFAAYTSNFKTIISLGLILGTALVVLYVQKDIPTMIKTVFTKEQLDDTKYFTHQRHFWSLRKTILFAAQVTVVAFLIFRYCRFPLSGTGEILMMIAVCAEYAFASFVGRKLRYAAMMIHSLSDVRITRNLFRHRELDSINWYVNVASTLTIIFVYVHVMFYYKGPFAYDTMFQQSVRIFLILPAIMATPVLLIFNFYPREVLRKLYSKSIDFEIEILKRKLRSENFNAYEKRAHLVEFKKMSRDELRYSLQLALTDLPFGITILAMVIQTLMK
ncbi:MAG: hypothetical protein QOF62_2348 [Pyrinomonadaceae bacterium]|nr:hypothetical protein [Pyrinomonadaceae bacterium]